MKEKLINKINFDLLGDITPSLLQHKSGITLRTLQIPSNDVNQISVLRTKQTQTHSKSKLMKSVEVHLNFILF